MRRIPFFLLLIASCSGPDPNVRSEDPYERFLGVKELSGRRDVDAVGELVQRLEDPHYLVVVGSLESLAAIGHPEFLQHLVARLKHDHPMVRAAACRAIAVVRNEEGIPHLGEALKDPEAPVRREAVKALAAFGKRPDVLGLLKDAAADKDPSVALEAREALKAFE